MSFPTRLLCDASPAFDSAGQPVAVSGGEVSSESEAEQSADISIEEASLPGSDVPSQYSGTSCGHQSVGESAGQPVALPKLTGTESGGWGDVQPVARLSIFKPSGSKKAKRWADTQDLEEEEAPWPPASAIEPPSASGQAKSSSEVPEEEAEGLGAAFR